MPALALYGAALILSVIELIRSKGASLLAWALALVCIALIFGHFL